MAKWTYEATRKGYANLWDTCTIKASDAKNADKFAKLIIKGETKYRQVEAVTGVYWAFIGALHMRESSCSFAGVLHNGEKIIGTKRKTRLVPAGRGPFATWQEAAIDALSLKSHLWIGRDWCPALMGYVSECFNGLGYVGKGVNSAYCWAGSNHEQTGKYVYSPVRPRDHAGKSALQRVVQTFFDNSAEKAVAALLDLADRELSEAELERLAKLIEHARSEGR